MGDKLTAQSSRRWWERLESASEIALLVGCLLVVAGLFFEDWIAAFRVSGEVAVIVGVTIEGLADGGIFLAAGRLRMIQDAELEQMRSETAAANERAAESSRTAAEANLEVARLSLELEKFRAPRIFDVEQRERVIHELKLAIAELVPYGSLRVEVFTVDNDDEVIRLRDQLIDLLLQAGWVPRMNFNRRITGMPVNGVTVEMQAGTAIKQLTRGRGNVLEIMEYNLGEKALALVRAFRNGGLGILGPFTTSLVTDAPIEIIVGNKPQ
jgi:hypothetical protein